MYDERAAEIAVLDLYERYREAEGMFLTGRFGGARIEIRPIKGAHPDDRCWRVYMRQAPEGRAREQQREPRAAREPQAAAPRAADLTKVLAAVGMQARHTSRDELQADLGFDLDDA
jgi:hypothetical protein